MKKIHLFFMLCFVFLFYSEAYAKSFSSSSRSSASSSSRSSSYSSCRSTSTSKNTSGNNYSANKSTWSWNATTVAPNKVKIDTAIKQPVSTKSIVTLKPNKETKVVIVKQKTPVAYYKTNPSYHNNSSSDVANAAITAVAVTAIANSANADQAPAVVRPVQAIAQPVVYPQQSSNQSIVTKKVDPIVAFDFINDCYKWICD